MNSKLETLLVPQNLCKQVIPALPINHRKIFDVAWTIVVCNHGLFILEILKMRTNKYSITTQANNYLATKFRVLCANDSAKSIHVFATRNTTSCPSPRQCGELGHTPTWKIGFHRGSIAVQLCVLLLLVV
jgi:hypothetical protein